MRHARSILPTLLLLACLPAIAAPSDPPQADPAPIVRPLRAGSGQPRVRDTAATNKAAKPTQVDHGGVRHFRLYQIPKPGEGEPKG